MSGVLRILIDVVCVGGAWDFYNGPVTDPERQRSCLDGNVTAGHDLHDHSPARSGAAVGSSWPNSEPRIIARRIGSGGVKPAHEAAQLLAALSTNLFRLAILEPDFRTRIVNGWEARGNGLQTAGANCPFAPDRIGHATVLR